MIPLGEAQKYATPATEIMETPLSEGVAERRRPPPRLTSHTSDSSDAKRRVVSVRAPTGYIGRHLTNTGT
jgi:hypothetical protein